jgi:alpha-methylacyl-CoA racemase
MAQSVERGDLQYATFRIVSRAGHGEVSVPFALVTGIRSPMALAPHLDGVRVLDFSTVGPGARCARILADYGAELVKVGAPLRSGVQREPPFHSYGANRGMKRIRIDLKASAGREAFLRLAEGADVVLESFRPGVMRRLGVGFEDVRERNPRIVFCSTSGYGQSGPYAQWAGHDLNYLALGGYLDCSSPRADGGPPLPGATMADIAAGGMQAAIAILAALLRAQRSGEGEYLDVSVADGVLFTTSLWIDQYLATGERPGPGHDVLTGRYAWYDCYRTRDGKWLAVGAIEAPFLANLCKALGLERWIAHQEEDAVQDAMRADFRRVFATRDRDDWVRELAPANTCVAPVYSVPELAQDPHFAERKVFCEATHPAHGRFRQVGPVFAGGDRERAAHEALAYGHSDAEALLGGAGFTAQEIASLFEENAVA